MNILLDLFLTFAKIGCFTFGGGYAMIALIEDACVERKQWISHDDMMTLTVIAESTPGPISINCATYVGYKKAGLPGAIVATFGMVLPSFVIIYAISQFLKQFLQITWIANAFKGIRVAVGVLILDAGINMMQKMGDKKFSKITLAVSLVVMLAISLFDWKVSVILLIAVSAVAGILFTLEKEGGKA